MYIQNGKKRTIMVSFYLKTMLVFLPLQYENRAIASFILYCDSQKQTGIMYQRMGNSISQAAVMSLI